MEGDKGESYGSNEAITERGNLNSVEQEFTNRTIISKANSLSVNFSQYIFIVRLG